MFGLIKGIAKQSIIYAVADLCSRGIGFFMIPLYTYYLSTSDYGTLELIEITSYVVGLFMGMGIAQAVFRFYYEFDEESKQLQVFSVSLITIWIVVVPLLGGLLFFSKPISSVVLGSSDYFRLFQIMFITLIIQLGNEIPLAYLRIKQKSVTYVIANFIKLLLTLGLNILFIVHFKMGVMGILLSSLTGAFFLCLFLLIYILRRIKISYSFSLLKQMLNYSIPIMWSWFGMLILHSGDRFILQKLSTLSTVGLYSLAYKFGVMTNLLILSPFLMIWAPKRFEIVKEPDAPKIYATIFTYFIFAEIFVSLCIAVPIKNVISLISEPSYHESYKYVSTILLGYIFYGAFQYIQFGIHLKKKTKYLAHITLAAAGLNIGLNIALISIMDVWGAALSTLLSFMFLMIATYYPSQKLYCIKYEIIRLIKLIGTALIIYFVSLSLDIPDVMHGLSKLFREEVNSLYTIVTVLLIKAILVLSFPLLLKLIGFYSNEELEKIALIWGKAKTILKLRKAN